MRVTGNSKNCKTPLHTFICCGGDAEVGLAVAPLAFLACVRTGKSRCNKKPSTASGTGIVWQIVKRVGSRQGVCRLLQ